MMSCASPPMGMLPRWAQNTTHNSRTVGEMPTITASMSGTSRRTILFTITPFARFLT